ncbi:MAG: hypothetical protein KatS3mg011_0865 [Acidimicrobiia bacterium]|nr:MAG: hypothetical protein KatS3mg011_0865 [Acidimicrobiia bacterium]
MDSRYRPRPHILEEEVDDDLVLYDPSRESVTVLNTTAADIWRLCDGSLTLDEVVERLAAAYGTSAEQIRGDVARTVGRLVEEGLLEE